MITMAKKKRGRPKNATKSIRTWHNHSEKTIQELEAIVEHLLVDAPPFLDVSQRTVIAALIHRAKQDVDAGRLSYGELFGVTADSAK